MTGRAPCRRHYRDFAARPHGGPPQPPASMFLLDDSVRMQLVCGAEIVIWFPCRLQDRALAKGDRLLDLLFVAGVDPRATQSATQTNTHEGAGVVPGSEASTALEAAPPTQRGAEGAPSSGGGAPLAAPPPIPKAQLERETSERAMAFRIAVVVCAFAVISICTSLFVT